MAFVELQVTSNFSFLRGASHPDELVEQAAALGYSAIAITDRNSLAGIVRAHVAAKKAGVKLIPACRLDLQDGVSLLAYPTKVEGYSGLSTLLSVGNARADKGDCLLYKQDIFAHAEGIKFIVIPPAVLTQNFELEEDFVADVKAYAEQLPAQLYLGASRSYQGDDAKKLYRIDQLSNELDVPMIALGDVYYHEVDRRELQDVLTCVRKKCTIHEAGFRLYANAERYLKPMEEMQRLFRNYPDAIVQTLALADACTFSLDELHYVYPEELTASGRSPQEELIYLTWKGTQERFGDQITDKIKETIAMELEFIERKNYASYFLTVYDYVDFARNRGILCQGRGSAANSTVCYCLGITSVNPMKIKLLFSRFMSDARDEPPDIDVDFEHERREEVIQYIYNKYGRDRAAIVATVTQERAKGALRDVGKAMGLSMDALDRLSKAIGSHWDNEIESERFAEQGFSLEDAHFRKILELSNQLIGFPRQLGQHTGGFVITQDKLHNLCPIINARMPGRTNLEWNKDDLEALGFLKVDVLGLGMLTCIRKAFDLLKQHYDVDATLVNIPQDDPVVYDMISRADTVGVFQIESRAQMSMLPRLRPREFYDLVIQVAIVRPGPIQGDMVHPYLRRRNGEEAPDYPSEEIKHVLERTLGVPLFQEQAMEIAIVAAGFTPAEADALRRAMATFKSKGEVSRFRKKMVEGMLAKGYAEEFAHRVFKQLEGFGSYGFPESHAASFAMLVYVSCWIKCHYPDIFLAALLNSQPMGFYQPAQLVADARKHDVPILPIDVNYSSWDNTLERTSTNAYAVRLGFRQVKGLAEVELLPLLQSRKSKLERVEALSALLAVSTMEKLADADALRSLGLNRREALWAVAAQKSRPIALFEGQAVEPEAGEQISLPFMTPSEQVVQDYASTSLSLKAHPLEFIRPKLDGLHVVRSDKLKNVRDGMPVKVCGLVTVKQRPGTAKGVLFVTIEDEAGFVNIVIWSSLFERYRRAILQSKLFMVQGHVQVEGEVIHVVAKQCFNMNDELLALSDRNQGAVTDPFSEGRNFK